MTNYGYIRTSKLESGDARGMHPETQELALSNAGVPPENVFRDVGLSGATATTSRKGWKALDSHLKAGDSLTVAAVDRIGRNWRNTVWAMRDLRERKVRLVSLAYSEGWLRYLFAEDDSSIEAMVGDVMANMVAWLAQAEYEAMVRRTNAGIARARAQGKRLGRPPAGTADLREHAAQLREEGMATRRIARILNLPESTVRGWLKP